MYRQLNWFSDTYIYSLYRRLCCEQSQRGYIIGVGQWGQLPPYSSNYMQGQCPRTKYNKLFTTCTFVNNNNRVLLINA